MRKIISLAAALLAAGALCTVGAPFVLAGVFHLNDTGHDTWATLLPWLSLAAVILVLKLVYKLAHRLIDSLLE